MSASVLDLSSLGWSEALADGLPPGTVPGRVARVDRGGADVLAADGEHRVRFGARVRRAAAEDPVALPCVGDWAALLLLPEGRLELLAVLPRRSALVRGGVERMSRGGLSGDGSGQVLAANVDVAFIVEPAMHSTDVADLGRIERLTALAWESGAQPVVLLTKADLYGPEIGHLVADVSAAVPGVAVHPVCSISGDGVAVVRSLLFGSRTAVLLGASGAGKSTLVNALAGEDVMTTQQVRAADGRGRHTTVHRELIVLPGGGLVIDTPGIRRVGLYSITDGVDLVFADIEQLADACRFADCGHGDEPGCAVQQAVGNGALPERRLHSWRKLQREADWMASRTDAKLRQERAREWKIVHKEMRRSGRARP